MAEDDPLDAQHVPESDPPGIPDGGRALSFDEAELARIFPRAKSEDPEARRLLFERIESFYRRTPIDEGTLQDCHLQILRSLPTLEYRSAGALGAWLAMVQRSIERRRRSKAATAERKRTSYEVEEAPGREDPVASAQRSAQASAVHEAVERLPPELRQVLISRDFESRTFPDLAERLGLNESTARHRYSRALSMLARELRGWSETATET